MNPAWTKRELADLERAVANAVPESEYERMFPGRTKAAVKQMAIRQGFVRGTAITEVYISGDEAQRQTGAAHKTVVSIIEYAAMMGRPVRTVGSPPRVRLHQSDFAAAVSLWNDTITLREYAIESGAAYSTLRSRLKSMRMAFRDDVKPSHRRMTFEQWTKLFEWSDAGSLAVIFVYR